MIKKLIETAKKQKGLLLLLIGIAIGIILIFFGNSPLKTSLENSNGSTEDYAVLLESKLEEMINKIDGLSNAQVMVTLKCGNEYVYALDSNSNNEKHVIIEDSPLYIKEYFPEVEGVAVVCKGGNNAVAKEKITELICSVLGLYSTHVYVTE